MTASHMLLYLTLAIAVIAAVFLFVEWRSFGDKALRSWTLAFSIIAFACALSPLREHLSVHIGFWAANGLLLLAHLFMLNGVHQLVGRPGVRFEALILLPWLALLPLPLGDPAVFQSASLLNAATIAVLAAACSFALLRAPQRSAPQTALGCAVLAHGCFYVVKTGVVLLALMEMDPIHYRGTIVEISLFWGILMTVTLTFLMVASIRARHYAQMTYLMDRDPLTGTLNRRAFERQANTALRLSRATGRASTMLLLDLDHFKQINDTHGHASGDRVLIVFADHVSRHLPPRAVFARIGGEEFAVLLPGEAASEALDIAETIRSEFEQAGATLDGRAIGATVSIGAVSSQTIADLDTLLGAADRALYAAKQNGRNRIVANDLGDTANTLDTMAGLCFRRGKMAATNASASAGESAGALQA